jgi:UDP-glucose-4-epimerase GalE
MPLLLSTKETRMNVIVTGSAGYIGGQVALQLKDAGHTVTGIDCRPLQTHQKGLFDSFVLADFDSNTTYKKLLDIRPEAIVHCAGTSLVGPSIANPSEYYFNNAVKTLELITFITRAMPQTRLIFSSSAATYGEPIMTPCQEVDPCLPVSPYGESKLMIDMMLESYHRAYRLDYVSFRYFNACGADPLTRHGQEPNATHIIARVLESIRDDVEFTLNGIDFPTDDGSCVRDYVHVGDIAQAHVMALDRSVHCGVYNLGSNIGTSNREIIAAAERVTGKKLKVIMGPARPGDPPVLTASAAKFGMVAGNWKQYELDDMIQHAWKWYTK